RPDERGSDILSLLVAATDDDGQPMGEDELCDELITLLVAGHETTATALSWAVACILADAEVAARLDADLARLRTPGGELDAAALASLDYLDAVIRESLRLRPVVPDVVREVQRPFTLGDYTYPPGVNLTPCIHLAHRRPEAFPEPDRFRPDRFVGAKIDPYSWFPFGGGIRRCIGMAFALYEMKIVLGVIFSGARLRLASPGAVRGGRRSVTLAPAGGTRVILDERKEIVAPRRAFIAR